MSTSPNFNINLESVLFLKALYELAVICFLSYTNSDLLLFLDSSLFLY
ncbi:3818_t:CDS:2 [Funneliformis mosseae]|uniref:3818_t:CDS:1 n=1 Tax=Funneliformis mosseae TaxID=27381 RepID=A0A9N8ZYD3_FUNMO|nr:3818_t:CDS:2 [Funneliformis mosseae]